MLGCRITVYMAWPEYCEVRYLGKNLALSEGQFTQIIFLHVVFMVLVFNKKKRLERQFCSKDLCLPDKPKLYLFILIVF